MHASGHAGSEDRPGFTSEKKKRKCQGNNISGSQPATNSATENTAPARMDV